MEGLFERFKRCNLCPRGCGVDRRDKRGFCGESDKVRISYIGPHFGEEPPISGVKGSGTVFFTGCSLKCGFCQNHQISRGKIGRKIPLDELVDKIVHMIVGHEVHNINFVTPDHFFPYVFHTVSMVRRRGYRLPVVLNLSGYQSSEMVKISDEYTDIYLSDFKYGDKEISKKLSSCEDYPSVALDAISHMVSQKGFLDSFFSESPVAKRGVLVRHLVLPGMLENSISALSMLRIEFGKDLPLSIMSQYTPIVPQKIDDLNRYLEKDEYQRVCHHAIELGFRNLFIQSIPGDDGKRSLKIGIPDFTKDQPFIWDHGSA